MAEKRSEVKERLQSAGRWQKYLDLREQLAKSGLTAAQAREQALRQIDSTLPEPCELSATDGPNDHSPAENLDQVTAEEESGPDFGRHVPNYDAAQWVAERIANLNVRPQDAPNGLAWGLLKWVRLTPANETTFWGSIWPKLLPTGAALKQRQEKEWDQQSPCPTCGREPEPVDEGTERVRGLLDTLLSQCEQAASHV